MYDSLSNNFVNLKLTIRINVLEEDFVKRGRLNTKDCPIARAIKRQLQAEYCSVSSKVCVFSIGQASFLGALPVTVQDFMYNWDVQGIKQPISFDLPLY